MLKVVRFLRKLIIHHILLPNLKLGNNSATEAVVEACKYKLLRFDGSRAQQARYIHWNI